MTDVASLSQTLSDAGVHTVELAVVDNTGHLRGKRIPTAHFLNSVAIDGCHIADAIYILDLLDDIIDSPYTNMELGFGDMHLAPQLDSVRLLTHRPGYAVVFARPEVDHQPMPLAPETALDRQVARCEALGHEPLVATEMEFYLCRPDGTAAQGDIKYSSLTNDPGLEVALADMRAALAGAGLGVESSNFEYGIGQMEINVAPADAVTTARNTVLYRSIVKQVAAAHDLVATFMPKPWAEQSGNGMHVHTSLRSGGSNAFADAEDGPNELMGHWVAGQVAHASALSLLGSALPNGHKRLRPYSFAPIHAHWGLDNRSVLCRCTVGSGGANRVEFRMPGSDANPYLVIAGLLAAGADGIERSLDPGAAADGDLYEHPGEHPEVPLTVGDAIDAFAGSELAGMLGDEFADNFAIMARAELAKFTEAGGDPASDDVTEWEFDRYLRHA